MVKRWLTTVRTYPRNPVLLVHVKPLLVKEHQLSNLAAVSEGVIQDGKRNVIRSQSILLIYCDDSCYVNVVLTTKCDYKFASVSPQLEELSVAL